MHSIGSLSIAELQQGDFYQGEFSTQELSTFLEMIHQKGAVRCLFFGIILIRKGKSTLSIDGHLLELRPGTGVFIKYHQVLSTEQQAIEGEVVLFTRAFYNLVYTANSRIQSDTAFGMIPSRVDFKKNESAELFSYLELLKKEAYREATLSREILCLHLKTLVLNLVRKSGDLSAVALKTSRKAGYVEEFKTRVGRGFKEWKRTSDYAQFMGLSPNYLNAVIKERLGSSAESYIQRRVVLEAERLLLNTDLSVSEIAYELGFTDKSHFGKYFKKVRGTTPNQFRLRGH